MKRITIIAVAITLLISVQLYAQEQQKGQIIGNFDAKVKILLGDKAITDLGKKDGIIKGDILSIFDKKDVALLDSVGKCAVVETYDKTSVCEIFKMQREIGLDAVVINKLAYSDSNFYPVVFQLLTKTVEPYEPQKDITVYVHNIYDENNNITKFSEKLRKEIKTVFYQKKRIKSVGKIAAQDFSAYLPSEYAESNQVIEEYMRKDNIDVIIAGTYKVRGDKIEVSLYKVDKNFEDIALDTTMNGSLYTDLTSVVTGPYIPIRKEKNVFCDVYYRPIYYKLVGREDRNSIIETETRNDPFLEYSFKRVDFNIISPVEFKIKIDNNEITFDKAKDYALILPTGKHEITASFKKGYFFNDSLLLTNENVVRKSIILSLDKPDDLVIEVEATPVAGRESIDFKIYKQSARVRPVIKPVLKRETIKQVETFKD